jgi:hypothetical protein
VGIQRGTAVIDLVPGDAREAVFELTVDVTTAAGGGIDFRGPYVHGRPGQRFLYLSWGELTPSGQFAMFRRAKLHLSALAEHDINQALTIGTPLEAVLDLTDEHGGPLCASVHPPRIHWHPTTEPATPPTDTRR